MNGTITGWRLERFDLPGPRVLGDSHDRIEALAMGSIELESSSGHVGLGFFWSPSYPLAGPPRAELERAFETTVAPALLGRTPFELTSRLERPRSFAVGRGPFADAVDQALWDLQGKELGLPLYRLLGGHEGRVPAYASGLDYHLSTDEVQAFFAAAAEQGFKAFKVKVGRPRLADDLERLLAVADAVGDDGQILVDANEAWTPKETIRRTHAYLDAGIDLFWVEDPILRHDVEGMALLVRELPVHLCIGDYLDPSGKVELLQRRACDILRVGDHISEGHRLAWLAAEHGVPVVIHNTSFDLGVHLGAAVPEVLYMEYSFLGYERLVEEPIHFERGYAVAPERPGHGLVLSEAARAEYAR